jgi:DNA-binding CsgD family transcriptional regulator
MHALIRACAVEGGLAELRPRLLYELNRLVPFDAAFVAAADPETLLFTAAFADDALAEAAPRFLDGEFADWRDVNRFAELAVADDPVSSIDRATNGEWAASRRWAEVIRPLGMGDEARVALRVDGVTWGFLCLHRTGPRGFDAGELETLRRAAPHVGAALRGAVAAAGRSDASTAGDGLILVDDAHVVAADEAAQQWLSDLTDGAAAIGDPLPFLLLAVVRRLEAVEAARDVDLSPAGARFRTRSGAVASVRATRLRLAGGDGPVALTIAPASGADHADLRLVAHGLTPAQRRVAALVLRGRTTRQIVAELRISEHTVQDHLKAVFDKLGVRSRRELVMTLLRGAE